jgi:putative NADH-flavin reductase
MKILVLGATGGTGREVVTQALGRGHDVTVLVRDPSRLPAADRVRVITGDLRADPEVLRAAVAGQDAVVSALGVGNSLKSHGLITYAVPALVQAMTTAGVGRLVFTSAYGVGDTWRDAPLLPRIVMRLLLRDLYADKAAGETLLRQSTINWTLVHPVTLTNGPRTGRTQHGERLALSGFPRISRADVAEFLLAQLDDTRYVRKSVIVR